MGIGERDDPNRPGSVDTLIPATARAGEGDRAAWVAAAYRDHSRVVFNVALRVCGPGYAEDVTQEVFLRLWRLPDRYDPSRGSLRTFLLIIAHHCSLDMLRQGDARRNRDLRAARLDDTPAEDMDGRIEQNEVSRRIHEALDALPPKEKTAIITAFYGECTYTQAALVLGEAEGTVKSRIRAGLGRLAPLLGTVHSSDH